jgi:hypothetical protein
METDRRDFLTGKGKILKDERTQWWGGRREPADKARTGLRFGPPSTIN